jgi:hypothetical protein
MREPRAGDTCTVCGKRVTQRFAPSGGIDDTFDSQEPYLGCDCLAGPTVPDD